MKRFAIIGHPVSHSLSPLIHNTAFEALGIDARYEAIDVEAEDLKEKVKQMRSEGFGGFSVTIPHKESILGLLDKVDEEAQAVGAVNAVVNHGGLTGYNTDMYGFLKLIEPYQHHIAGSEVLLLGAGGAARAALFVLLTVIRPRSVTILNRTSDRAEALATSYARFADRIPLTGASLFQDGLQDLVNRCGTIINATSVGLKPYTDATPLEEIKFRSHHVVVDLIYTPRETTLVKTARSADARAVGGLAMLLFQAAQSFRLWTAREMPMDVVVKKVEENL